MNALLWQMSRQYRRIILVLKNVSKNIVKKNNDRLDRRTRSILP